MNTNGPCQYCSGKGCSKCSAAHLHVVPIQSRRPESGALGKAGLLRELEEHIKEVPEAEIDSYAIVVCYKNGAIGTTFHQPYSIWTMIGAVRLLERRLLEAAE